VYRRPPDQRHPHHHRVNSHSSNSDSNSDHALDVSSVVHYEEEEEDQEDGTSRTMSDQPRLSSSPPSNLSPPPSKSNVSRQSSPVPLSPPGLERNDTSQSAQSMTPRIRRDLRISPNTMHMLWFSGLRGAVAYACVRSFPDTFGHANEFTVTTMVIVLVTVFCLGSTTECALNIWHIEQNVDEDLYMENWHRERKEDGLILRFEDFIMRYVVRAPTSGIAVNSEEAAAPDGGGGGGSDAAGGPIRTLSPYHHSMSDAIEMTELGHFENMDRLRCSSHHVRKRESVFDYGGDHSRD
jgi:hypothetical protein